MAAASVTPTLTECRAVGVITDAQLGPLLELLRGLSGGEGRQKRSHEIVQATQVGPRVEIRLQRDLFQKERHTGPEWTLRSETVVTRGNVKELPVSVKTVTDFAAGGINVPAFWQNLGLSHSYESIREGTQFRLNTGGESVDVNVLKVFRIPERENLDSAVEVSPKALFVEAVCRVSGGLHTPATAAIGRVGEFLRPHVKLQKG